MIFVIVLKLCFFSYFKPARVSCFRKSVEAVNKKYLILFHLTIMMY